MTPLFLIGNGLGLEGSSSKKKDKQLPGIIRVYIYIYIYKHIITNKYMHTYMAEPRLGSHFMVQKANFSSFRFHGGQLRKKGEPVQLQRGSSQLVRS